MKRVSASSAGMRGCQRKCPTFGQFRVLNGPPQCPDNGLAGGVQLRVGGGWGGDGVCTVEGRRWMGNGNGWRRRTRQNVNEMGTEVEETFSCSSLAECCVLWWASQSFAVSLLFPT